MTREQLEEEAADICYSSESKQRLCELMTALWLMDKKEYEAVAAGVDVVFTAPVQISSRLPCLMNTKTGRMAWVPSMYGDAVVVVVSVPIVAHAMKGIVTEEKVRKFFGKGMTQKHDIRLREAAVDYESDQFMDMLFGTPFRPSKKRQKHKKMFFVAESGFWRETFSGCVMGLSGDDMLQCVPSGLIHNYRDVEQGYKVRELGYRMIAEKDKCRIPGFGRRWCVEWFSEAVVRFFQILPEQIGKVHVVASEVER